VTVQSKQRVKVANSKCRASSKKLTAKLSDPKRKKNLWRTMRLLCASDAMVLRSTRKAYHAEDAMALAI